MYSSSVVKAKAPPYPGEVTVRVGSIPEGAEELGTVEAYGIRWRRLQGVLDELRAEAARIGANFVKIDEIRSQWSTVDGTPATGNGQIGTAGFTTVRTTLVGRAFRAGR